jgi:hypothetical protein
LNLPGGRGKLAAELEMLVDKSKLAGDLWVRMTWAPKDGAEADERPIALITDRRRWVIGLIPVVLGILLLSALFLAHVPLVLLLLPMAIAVAGARYGGGGKAGYYEVNKDGSLGDFLGRKIPVVLRYMRRAKS